MTNFSFFIDAFSDVLSVNVLSIDVLSIDALEKRLGESMIFLYFA